MQDKKAIWVENCTNKQSVILFLLWLTAIILLTLSATDISTKSPLQRKNIGMIILYIFPTFTIFEIGKSYFKNKKWIKKTS